MRDYASVALGIFALVVLMGTIVFACLWLNSGTDTWSWTNIDADCGVFTTQIKDAWFTPGQDGSIVREVYCRKEG